MDVFEAIGKFGGSMYRASQARAKDNEAKRAANAVRELSRNRQSDMSSPEDPASFLPALRERLESREAQDTRTLGNWASMPVGYHLKTPERSAEDQKRTEMMRALLNEYGYPQYGKEPESWSGLPSALAYDMMRYATDEGGFRKDTDSPYEYHGFLGKGAPLHTLVTWAQGTPGMVMAAGEMGAKMVDPLSAQEKNPEERFMHALNTFTAPVQYVAEKLGYASPVSEGHSAWSAQDAAQKKWDEYIKYDMPQPDLLRSARDEQIGAADVQMLGKEYINNRFNNSPDLAQKYVDDVFGPTGREWISTVGGSVLDDLLNPLLDVPGIRAAATAKKGRLAKTAYQLGQELTPGILINSYNGNFGRLGDPEGDRVRKASKWAIDPRAWGGQ